MKKSEATRITRGIIKIILIIQNGFTEQQIEEEGLVSDCEGSELFQAIEYYLNNRE